MALTPSIQTSQADVEVVQQATAANEQISQADVLAVYNFPAERVDVSAADLVYLNQQAAKGIEVSQADVIFIARGRVADPRVIAWTFTLDGHDYYVLRLGLEETIVFDNLTREWYLWSSVGSNLWRAYHGTNWRGARRWANEFGSDVVVGDDGNGAIYVLNPDEDVDDDPVSGPARPRQYEREVAVQHVITNGYDYEPCYGIQMFGSVGKVSVAEDIELITSDDRGVSYVSAGVRQINAGEYMFRLDWQSLGSMRAPGRLFRVTDRGAMHRIDSIQMILGDSADG